MSLSVYYKHVLWWIKVYIKRTYNNNNEMDLHFPRMTDSPLHRTCWTVTVGQDCLVRGRLTQPLNPPQPWCSQIHRYEVALYTHTHTHTHTIEFTYLQGEPKNDPTCFCQNFVKSLPNLIIFGTQIAKTIKLCEYTQLPISPNLCQCTTM